jgi:hypothetical protein
MSRADAVFLGRLVSREVSGGSVSSDPALHVLAVTEVYKGSAHAEQGVVSAASGGSRGLELTGEGPLAVFATRSVDVAGDQYRADLCGGHGPGRRAARGCRHARRSPAPDRPAPTSCRRHRPGLGSGSVGRSAVSIPPVAGPPGVA